MKRSATGSAHRGPVAPQRQRRTIRLVQIILVVTAGALLMFAGYSYGRAAGYSDGRAAGTVDAPRPPSLVQTVVLVALGGIALGAAVTLNHGPGVRVPTPARLEALAGRAERVVAERAGEKRDS